VGTYTWQGMRAKHVPLLVYIVMHAIVDPMTSVLLWYLISSILFPPSYPSILFPPHSGPAPVCDSACVRACVHVELSLL